MQNNFFSHLNKDQYQAVSAAPGPVLVLAGPGTGKTRLLVSRIIWLIEKENIPPEKILALTFTNKAAGEMRSRLLDLIGERSHLVRTSTFHSFALDLLRKYHSHIGLSKYFTVCDQDYQSKLIKNLAAAYIRDNLDKKVQGILLSFRNHVVKNRKLPGLAQELYSQYCAHLQKYNLIDFDQIMVKCRELFQNNTDLLREYQHLYPAILIDEFQDTDPVQYDILKLMALKDKNIFAVADDDQSIYSWRGANPENVKKFITDFQIKEPVFLQINYRSGNKILNAAGQIIQKTARIEPNKNLRIEKNIEDNLEMKFFQDEHTEIEYILKKIASWRGNGIGYKEIAVIYPYHKIGQELEQYFMRHKIPYQMAEGRSMMDHPAFRKVILYLRLIRDAEDPVALEELVYYEIGQTIAEMIKQEALKKSISFRKSLYNFYRDRNQKLTHDVRLKIQVFVNHLANLVNLKDFYTFTQLLDEIYMHINTKDDNSLAGYLSRLEPVSAIDMLKDFSQVNLEGKTLYIAHSDDRIRFIAGLLIKTVLPVNIAEKYDAADASDLIIHLEETDEQGVPVYKLKNNNRKGSLSCLFKFLQWYTTRHDKPLLTDYVVLDLETTDTDTDSCGIVEIAAIRVQNNKKREKLHSLINPRKPISKGAQQVHHISDQDVQNASIIENFWPRFKSFIKDSILVAHNGYQFDFPILDRFARNIDGQKLANYKYDSLVMARKLFPEQSNSIDALIDRFNLDSDTRHRALQDVDILIDIFNHLQKIRIDNAQRTSLEIVLDIVALGNIIENQLSAREDTVFFICGSRRLTSAFSHVRAIFAERFALDEGELLNQISKRQSQLTPDVSQYQNEEDLWIRIKEMAQLFNQYTIDEAIARFLGFISLNNSQDQLQDINAVSLLTFHAAKGLEFDKVILMGMENENMPSFRALRVEADDDRPVSQKMEEQRRLFYVGLTRAKTEVILTAVKNRGGWERDSSPFLREIKNGLGQGELLNVKSAN